MINDIESPWNDLMERLRLPKDQSKSNSTKIPIDVQTTIIKVEKAGSKPTQLIPVRPSNTPRFALKAESGKSFIKKESNMSSSSANGNSGSRYGMGFKLFLTIVGFLLLQQGLSELLIFSKKRTNDLEKENLQVKLETAKVMSQIAQIEQGTSKKEVTTSSKATSLPQAFTQLVMAECTKGEKMENWLKEGYGKQQVLKDGFEAYAGCTWIETAYLSHNIEGKGFLMEFLNPEKTEVVSRCSAASECLPILNKIREGDTSKDKVVRLVVPYGGFFKNYGPK